MGMSPLLGICPPLDGDRPSFMGICPQSDMPTLCKWGVDDDFGLCPWNFGWIGSFLFSSLGYAESCAVSWPFRGYHRVTSWTHCCQDEFFEEKNRGKITAHWHRRGLTLELISQTLLSVVGHSPGVGYPSSCFIPDDWQQLFLSMSFMLSLLRLFEGIMGAPTPLIVARLSSLLLMRFPGPPNPFFVCCFIFSFFSFLF